MKIINRNEILLHEFMSYCEEHPQERFWQALRNWASIGYLMADDVDTFYWEYKNETL